MLSCLPDAAVDGIIDRDGLPSVTEKTIADRDGLKGELSEIRDRGYAIDDEERVSRMGASRR
ncbi:IclR family transcriptional regulator C-terminal domain-containing protein [Halosolutus gelatinilyticus]|uniref:IclR family transcriptional regulator C-terminal domain-containing protein n=1 Tax=Halosolutus gelatinilyticus TaxID=2931975 RepID=UPI001FF5BB12|nr:IclR family transcriptional regulator C-terminal domain-containing protein [Halosolutus gelatinilyticus]